MTREEFKEKYEGSNDPVFAVEPPSAYTDGRLNVHIGAQCHGLRAYSLLSGSTKIFFTGTRAKRPSFGQVVWFVDKVY